MREVLGEEDKRRRHEEGKNLLTADFSASEDRGKDSALFIFKHGTENQVVQLGVRERREKGGGETRGAGS